MTITLQRHQGFTLAEMAVVVLIMGIAMTMGLKMVTANLDNAAYSETKSRQERIKIALIGFLRTNGRLPCPDNVAGVAVGTEAAACAAALGYGVIPWQTLGLPRDAAQDGWGNLFTYRVANVNLLAVTPPAGAPPLHVNANQNWTITVGAGAFDIGSLVSTIAAPGFQTLLIQNRDPAPGPNAESRNAIVVILSHGKNGLGAKTTRVGGRIAGAAGDELTNATPGTTFVRRPVTENTAAIGGAYDDVVTFMTPQDLLQPLITERTLLANCQAYCPVPAAGCVPAAIPIGATPAACP